MIKIVKKENQNFRKSQNFNFINNLICIFLRTAKFSEFQNQKKLFTHSLSQLSRISSTAADNSPPKVYPYLNDSLTVILTGDEDPLEACSREAETRHRFRRGSFSFWS